MKFNLSGVPEDLPPGRYATRVTAARWERTGPVVDLEYRGPYDDTDPCLFPITKHLDEDDAPSQREAAS